MKLTSRDLRDIAEAVEKLQQLSSVYVTILQVHNSIRVSLERHDSQIDGVTYYVTNIETGTN